MLIRLLPVEPKSAAGIEALAAERLPIVLEACCATAVPVSVNRLVVVVRDAPRLEAVWVGAAPAVVVVAVPEVDVVDVVLEASFPSKLVDVDVALVELPLELEVELVVELDELLVLDVVELVEVVLAFALPTRVLCRPRPLRLPRNCGASRAANRSA